MRGDSPRNSESAVTNALRFRPSHAECARADIALLHSGLLPMYKNLAYRIDRIPEQTLNWEAWVDCKFWDGPGSAAVV